MYKVLLCWRYLRTRYLALVCIISVMLGVGTLIVVNSVMAGFSTKLRERLHGLLSDVVIEAWDYNGFADPEGKMALIRSDPFLKDRIEAMTPTLEVFAMMQFTYNDTPMMRAVRLIGIDPEGRARLGGFAEHVVDDRGNPKGVPTFKLTPDAQERYDRRHPIGRGLRMNLFPDEELPMPKPGDKPPPEPPPSRRWAPEGLTVGWAIAHFRVPRTNPDEPEKEVCTIQPGDDIIITTVGSGQVLRPVNQRFVLSDYFRSEMSEYDGNYVFVSLKHLQLLRTMQDRATSIQIKLRDYHDAPAVVKRLEVLLRGTPVEVHTWEQKQGPLLAAVSVEKGILNVLLFLIIAVAGFGILAIFSMIVFEKTRDIGILKALGASNRGVLNIFLGYGLLLGVVGAVLGTVMGVTFTIYINEIEKFLAHVTGMELFPRDVYYFDKIPTDIQPLAVLLVNFGSILIAVLFSVLPALRAALLHPVRALRYE